MAFRMGCRHFSASATHRHSSLSLTGAARFACAVVSSESLSLNAGLAKVFGKAGYNPKNFFAGALFGSTTATISDFFIGEDPVTSAGQLAVNFPV